MATATAGARSSMNTIAIIPARGGSKGIPKKNLHLIHGYPLISFSIVAAKLSKFIERVVVSTDSPEIADTAIKFGADVPFLRPSQFAQDSSPDRDFVIHAIEWFEQNEGFAPALFVHLRPTTPLRDPELIDIAIKKIEKNPAATSLRSAHLCSESPFKWFLLRDDDFFKGLNTDDMDSLNGPRQMFPQVYIPNGYVDILKTDYIKKTKNIHGNKVLSFITPWCVELDSTQDIQQLEFELNNKANPLLQYLSENFPKGV